MRARAHKTAQHACQCAISDDVPISFGMSTWILTQWADDTKNKQINTDKQTHTSYRAAAGTSMHRRTVGKDDETFTQIKHPNEHTPRNDAHKNGNMRWRDTLCLCAPTEDTYHRITITKEFGGKEYGRRISRKRCVLLVVTHIRSHAYYVRTPNCPMTYSWPDCHGNSP